jgi:hypothetical protein
MGGHGSIVDRIMDFFLPPDPDRSCGCLLGSKGPDHGSDHFPPPNSTDHFVSGVIASDLYSGGALTEVWLHFPQSLQANSGNVP